MKQSKGTVFFSKTSWHLFCPLRNSRKLVSKCAFPKYTHRERMQIQYRDKGWIYKGGVTTHCCLWKWCLQSRPSDVICLFLHVVSCLSPSPCAPLAPKQSHLLICKVIMPGCFLHISSSFQWCVQRSHLLNKQYVLLFYFTQCCETDWTEFSQFSKHTHKHTQRLGRERELLELLWQNASDSPSCWRQPCWDTFINIWTQH